MKKGFYINLENKLKEYKILKDEISKDRILEDLWKLEREKPYVTLTRVINGGLYRDDSPLVNKVLTFVEYTKPSLVIKIIKKYCSDTKKKIYDLVEKLPTREKEILKLRFGLEGEQQTLQRTGEKFYTTGNKIKQIENKAINSIRKLLYLEQEERNKCDIPKGKKEVLSRRISDLELSVRATNILEIANVRYVKDLVQKTERDLLRYRNCGRKSLYEIKKALFENGLSLKMSTGEYKKI